MKKKLPLLLIALASISISATATETITYYGDIDVLKESEFQIEYDPYYDGNTATLSAFSNYYIGNSAVDFFTEIYIPEFFEYNYYGNLENFQITAIGEKAFYVGEKDFPNGWDKITLIELPESVLTIGTRAFQGLSALKSVYLPNSITAIGEFAFYSCSSLTEVTLPINLEKLEWYAFENCTSLETLVIGSEITEIIGPFNNTSLSEIYIDATTPPKVYQSDFKVNGNENHIVTVYIPTGTLAAYQEKWKTDHFDFVEAGIPSSVAKIESSDFSVRSIGGNLTVTADTEADVEVYSVGGGCISRSQSTHVELPLPSGIYLVKVGGKVKKVSHR